MSLSKVSGLLPPALRRSLSGAWLDLRTLPDRVQNPKRWSEPLQVFHNVGGGDFDQTGLLLLAQLRTYAGLTPKSSTLDIGCGTGRLAKPLSDFLDPSTSYVGFDLSTRAIVACRRRIGRTCPNFSFVKSDIANREYNPKGSIPETEFKFPAGDSSVDVVAAFSVFSHMTLPSISHYLREAARVMRPGGRFLFTAYALTAERVAAIERGDSQWSFQAWRQGSMVLDPRSPERAIAHPLEGLLTAITAAELRLPDGCRFGAWLGPADYDGGQDLFVAVKPSMVGPG